MRYTTWKETSNSTPIILWTNRVNAKTIRVKMDMAMPMDFTNTKLLVRVNLFPFDVMLNVMLALDCAK